jgi:hypothetical protein
MVVSFCVKRERKLTGRELVSPSGPLLYVCTRYNTFPFKMRLEERVKSHMTQRERSISNKKRNKLR